MLEFRREGGGKAALRTGRMLAAGAAQRASQGI